MTPQLNFMDIDELINLDITKNVNRSLCTNLNVVYQDIIQMCEIPAPTFAEEKRVEHIRDYIEKLNKDSTNAEKLLINVDTEVNNVIVRYPGDEPIAKLCVLAHIDTVFPKGTEIRVKKTNKIMSAPGIGDNSTSVAVMLNIVKAWKTIGYKPPFDILFVWNSCEEGLGDLKGTKAFIDFCQKSNNIDLKSFIALDSSLDRIIHIGPGVKRYKVTLNTKGGHSWGNFGQPSAIHELSKIIAEFSIHSVPVSPKTTYNIGLIEGGTSINSIAQQATMFVDLRSKDSKELAKLENYFLSLIKSHTENKEIKVSIQQVGNRPAGSIPETHSLVRLIQTIARKFDINPVLSIASTDANIPLSLGIPSVAIGCYFGKGSHTLEESIDIESLNIGIPYANTVLMSIIRWINKNKTPRKR